LLHITIRINQTKGGATMLWWVAAALAWLVGVYAQLSQEDLHWWRGGVLLGLGAVVAALGVSGPMGQWQALVRRCAAWICLPLLLGWWSTQSQALSNERQRWDSARDGQSVTVRGRLAELPQQAVWGTQMLIDVDELVAPGWGCKPQGVSTWVPWGPTGCPRRVLLRWAGVDAVALALQPGQRWQWPAKLHRPDGLVNPGGHDSELAQFERGVGAVGSVQAKVDATPAVLLSAPAPWDRYVFERWRSALNAQIAAEGLAPRVAGLVAGMTIGEQSAIATRDWDAMRQTGVAHLAAISGLHITMMGVALSWLGQRIWRRSARLMRLTAAPTVGAWLGLFGALAYALLSGWGVPAQRTVIMVAVVTLLGVGGRRWPWPLVLLVAAVVVTALDPWALLQAGFWLSFAAVGLLMLSGQAPDQLAGGEPLPLRRRMAQHLLSMGRTQWMAFAGLAPLSLVFFQAVSLVGLICNAVCIPLFTLVITPLAMLGLIWPACWRVLQPLADQTFDILGFLGAQPWAVWQSPAVLPWASGLGLMAGAWMLAPGPWRWRLMAAPALLPLLWPSPLSLAWQAPPQGHVQVLAVDVGQGTAVLVQTAGHALLFDTGPRYSDEMDAGRRVLIGMLRYMGIGQLDALMISHGDSDHVGGAMSVLGAVGVTLIRSSLQADHELLRAPDRMGHVPPHQPCLAGQRWAWDGVQFEVMHPFQLADEAAGLGDNARSCVLRVRAAGRQVLITADVEAPQEAALVAAHGHALQSEVLLVPHHGSRTSSTPALLAAVKPRVAVVQVGARNAYRHPSPQVMSRYEALGIPTVTTPACGAWHWQSSVQPTPHGPLGRCWREACRRYWMAR
jgi:competence protein ComEC